MSIGSRTDNLVKNVLRERYTYLRNNLRMTDDLAAQLCGWKPQLLDEPTFKQITASNDHGKPGDAFQKWHDYAASWYTEASLNEFCKCLEDAGNSAKPKLRQVAKKIKKTLKGKQEAQKDVITDTSDFLPYFDKMTPHLALLGVVLGVDDFATATIDGPGSLDEKCLAILRHWLHVTPNPTWKLFCNKLGKADIFIGLTARIAQDGVSGTTEREGALNKQQPNPITEGDDPRPRESYRHVKAKDVLGAFKWHELVKDIKYMLTVHRLMIMEREYNLIDSACNSSVSAYLHRGDPDQAATMLIEYFEKNPDGDALLRFCEFLRDESKESGGATRLEDLADKIERAVKAKGPPGEVFPGSLDIDPMETSSSRYSETETPPLYVSEEFLDLTPSHIGLNQVLLQIPLWESLAVNLGVPSTMVQKCQADPRGGLLALVHWRDGKCGELFPATWRFLLEQVGATSGPRVAEDLRQKASTEPTWSYDRQDSLRTEVEKALEKGAVHVEIVKCVTMGPPEVGKTQLKHALLGDFTPIKKSTDATTQATPAVEMIAAGEKMWETLDFEQLQSAMQITATKKDLPQRTSHEDPPSNSHEHTQSSIQDSTPEDHIPADVDPSHKDDSSHEDSSEGKNSTYPSQVTNIDQFHNLKENVVKAILQSQSSEDGINIHGAKLIYIVDSGGQPSFLDFHPVTATFAATYLLLYNMEEGLDAKPKMTYRKDYPTIDLPKSAQSNLEIVRRSLFTLHHFKDHYREKHERLTNLWGDKFKPATHDPPIIIIGTRRNEPTLKKDEERLQSECQRIPSMERVQLSFVNSLDPDRKEINRLQRLVCTNACNFQFPLSWFQLHLMCLASESRKTPKHERIPGVFTFSELRTLCLKEGLVSSYDEFKAMVTVFHSLGVFSCPDLDLHEEVEDSETLVFINPGLLFADVTKILEIPFLDLSKVLDKQSLVDLQQTGELTTDALEELGISNTLRSSHQGFHERLVRWLVHWGLAAEIDVGKRWFIPSVLPPRSSPSESNNSKPFEPFPLSICFLQESSRDMIIDSNHDPTFHYLPEGLFPHFIVQLVKAKYTLLPNKGKYVCPLRCRDLMSLRRRRDPSVPEFNIDLTDQASHLLVDLTPANRKLLDKPCLKTYSEAGAILAELINAAKKANTNLYHHSSYNIAICCSCPCGEFDEAHLARILEQSEEIECLYYKRSKPWEIYYDVPLKEVITSFLSHPGSSTLGMQGESTTGTHVTVAGIKRSRGHSSHHQNDDSSPKRKPPSGDSEEPAPAPPPVPPIVTPCPNPTVESYTHVKAKDVINSLDWCDLSEDIKDMLKRSRVNTMEKQYKLIDPACNLSIVAALDKGNLDDAAATLIKYFAKTHDGDALLKFCEFLRKEAKAVNSARLKALADKIERAVKTFR